MLYKICDPVTFLKKIQLSFKPHLQTYIKQWRRQTGKQEFKEIFLTGINALGLLTTIELGLHAVTR